MSIHRLALRLALAVALVAGAAGAAWAQQADTSAVLNLATNADPTLNPWTPGAVIESNLINTILFDQLTRYSPDDLTPVPALAVAWEAEEGGMSWVFELRQGVQWSDGAPFGAHDIAFTFNDVVLNADLGAQSASQFNTIERVEVIDDHTVRFVLKRPFSALPYYLASFAGIIPQHVLGDAENPLTVAEFNKGIPVTTGPFKVAEFVPGSFVRLEPNPLHWAGEPQLAGMIFRIIPDPNTQVAQALAGQLDVVTRLSPNVVASVEGSGRLEVLRQSQNLFFFVAPNHDDERFADVRVKQALLMAIDRQALIDALLDGFGEVATGPVAPMLGALYNDDVQTYAYDPEAAGALLDEAGWVRGADGVRAKDGQRLEFDMPTGQFGDLVPATLLVQQFWEDIGVIADVEIKEWNAYIQEVVLARNYEVTVAWWSMPPTADVAPYFSCSAANSGNNIPNYCSEELDALMDAGRAALTLDEQVEAYAAMQAFLAVELPYLYLWHPDILTAKSVALQGFPAITAATAFQHAVDWYVTR
ncbi:MAG: ABC transporter substrate-binding protein [Trueperaceae bacterium]|nr:MAG: ABC transporter substrate-binding protein [Trueperaceae bacterium]